jgi:hypothetical protein
LVKPLGIPNKNPTLFNNWPTSSKGVRLTALGSHGLQ